jgi:hypothetical protein
LLRNFIQIQILLSIPQMAQQQNFVIPALPVPVGLQALQIAAPAAVLYGPNLPIADAAVTAEHQYVKIIKRLKGTLLTIINTRTE